MLLRSVARQVATLFRGLSAVQHSATQQQVRLAASGPPEQRSSGDQQQPKYHWVAKNSSKWRTMVTIPASMLPGREERLQTLQLYSTPEAAAHAADLQQLALHGPAAAPFLNFSADSYSEEEVAEQQAVLLAKFPGLQLGGATGRPGLYRTHDPTGVRAAAARAADRASSVYDGSRPLIGVHEMTGSVSDLKNQMVIEARLRTVRVQYRLQPLTYLAAGCAYDIARIVLYGPQHSVNFPPDTYISSDMEAMGQDMQLMRPGIFAAAAARRAPSLPNYHNIQAGRAADAAVAAEAAAAKAAGYGSSICVGSQGFGASTHQSSTVRVICDARSFRYSRYFKSALAAACAVDMMRLAVGWSPVNLPRHIYSAENVAAMAAWLQVERDRLTAVRTASAATRAATVAAARRQQQQLTEAAATNSSSSEEGSASV